MSMTIPGGGSRLAGAAWNRPGKAIWQGNLAGQSGRGNYEILLDL